MKFPGEDYLVYAQDPVRSDAVSYARSGISRFLFSPAADPGLIRRDALALRDAFAARGLDYEIVFATKHPGVRLLVTGGEARTEQVPVWRTGEPIGDLRRLAADHELVYIYNTVKLQDVEEAFALRELYEFLLDPPAAKLVVFGYMQRSLFYAWGLAGSAVRIRGKQRRAIDRILDAKGGHHRIDHPDDARDLLDADVGHINRSAVARAMMDFIQQIPIAFKEGYENFVRPEDQNAFIRSLSDKFNRSNYIFSISGTRINFTPGDRRLCDYCSVRYACRLYKERSVCIMPGTDGKRFADHFATRDADEVINGVAAALQMQASRLERMVEEEYDAAEEAERNNERPVRDPEINKILNDVQRNATAYAKLLNPMLTRPQVAVQVNAGTGAVETLRQSEITSRQRAAAARELEAAGTPRDKLTPDMILEHIAHKEGKVIEGEVVDGVRNDF